MGSTISLKVFYKIKGNHNSKSVEMEIFQLKVEINYRFGELEGQGRNFHNVALERRILPLDEPFKT